MIFGIFKTKCGFCNKKDVDVDERVDSAYGSFLIYAYHENCFQKVLKNPRNYSHKKVDLAVEIMDSIREKEQKVGIWEKKQQEQIKRLEEFYEQRTKKRS